MSEHTPYVNYDPDYLTPTEADQLLSYCTESLPWRQESIQLFGRSVLQPRLQVWMGDPNARYRYSGTEFVPVSWDPMIKALADRLSEELGASFNSVLCNWYRDGRDSMGWHSDDEPELGKFPVIGSLSVGSGRRFVLRCKTRRSLKIEYALGHGDLLVMKGDTQATWQHGIPKTRRPVGDRINLTFRQILY